DGIRVGHVTGVQTCALPISSIGWEDRLRERRLSDIATSVDGRLVGEDARVSLVVTDSRLARDGALFVALPGTKSDGHRYLADARSEERRVGKECRLR